MNTDVWCYRNAVGRPAIGVFRMHDTGEIADSVHEVQLLWPAIHIIGVCNLDGAAGAMVRRNVLSTLGSLL